jgi:hypothetical protein
MQHRLLGSAPERLKVWQLPPGGLCQGAKPNRAFLSDLARVDPHAEVVWCDGEQRWVLYRKMGNELIKEFVLEGPNGEYRPWGPWLFAEMKRREYTAMFGCHSHERAVNLSLRALDLGFEAVEEQRQQEIEEIAGAVAEDSKPCFTHKYLGPTGDYEKSGDKRKARRSKVLEKIGKGGRCLP